MRRSMLWSVVVIGALSAVEAAPGGVVVTAWNFNGPAGTSEPSEGRGTASVIGGATANFAAGSPVDTSAPSPAENKGWNVTGFASQGTGSGERGVQFACSTSGFESIAVVWQERHSNSASRFVQFQYSLDGKAFTSSGLANDGVFEASLGGDAWQTERRVDLKHIGGVDGNANFAFRVVSVTDPATGQYLPTSPSANYSPTGTVRFDLVHVEGAAIPAPAALALGASGALLAAVSRRRK